jgi:membrane protein DedA with SNARE-associated domain
MSVPEAEGARAAERAAPMAPVPAAPGPGEPEPAAPARPETGAPARDPWADPRLPWHGKPRTADLLCWLAIVLSGVYYWATLPLRVSLVGTHPVVAVLMNGGTESIISAAAFASAGNGTLAVVLLAALPGLVKFDPLYWWAGRLWGERFIMALPGSRRVARHMPRVQQAGRRFTWPAVVVSSFLPIPRALIGVIAGWAGMRLVTFLILDLIGALLWAGMLAGLGYTLGHHAIVAARAISHYNWWVTIGIVALSVLFAVRSQRRPAAAPAAPDGG